MKKSFVYLVIVLMLATMLCACGMDSDEGVIGASPRPTDTIGAVESMLPDVSPTIIPYDDKVDGAVGTSSPQVGATDEAKVSPKVSDKADR